LISSTISPDEFGATEDVAQSPDVPVAQPEHLKQEGIIEARLFTGRG
jgi:hypothetical protein